MTNTPFADLDALTLPPVARIKLDGHEFEIQHPSSLPPRELVKLLGAQAKLTEMSDEEKEFFIEEKMAFLSPQMRDHYGAEAIKKAVAEARAMGKKPADVADAATIAGVDAVVARIRQLNSDQWFKLYQAITGAELADIDPQLRKAEESADAPANPLVVQPS